MSFCRVQPYGSIGLLVSFFISKMSYRYNFLSSECLTINDVWNTLYLSISPPHHIPAMQIVNHIDTSQILHFSNALLQYSLENVSPLQSLSAPEFLVLHWLLPSHFVPFILCCIFWTTIFHSVKSNPILHYIPCRGYGVKISNIVFKVIPLHLSN